MRPLARITQRKKSAGFTLVEVLIVMAILMFLVLPVVLFISGILRYLVTTNARHRGQDVMRNALTILDRDLKDAIEVRRAGNNFIEFYMDSHRAPWYDPDGDPDGDWVPNRSDPDDDGDAFEPRSVMGTQVFRNQMNNAVTIDSVYPWRQGFDLADDDDNNDGRRDVICRYRYNAPTRQIIRDFSYQNPWVAHPPVIIPVNLWRDATVIAENIISSTFTCLGSLQNPDTRPLGHPQGLLGADTNRDGILNMAELEMMDGAPELFPNPPILNRLAETAWVTMIHMEFTVVPRDTNKVVPANVVFEVVPPLMSIKRKYR